MKSFWEIVNFGRMVRNLGLSNAWKLGLRARQFSGLINMYVKGFSQPITIRGKTSDWWVFNQIIVCKEYPIISGIQPRFIVDAGANIGIASLYFLHHYPNAQIIAIEPDNENFQILQRNTRNYKAIEALEGAIWSRNTKLRILNESEEKFSFRIVEDNKSGIINGFSIDWILSYKKWNYIDILKLDVEGSERKILSENFEHWIDKTNILIIELHEQYSPGCAKSLFKAFSEIDFILEIKGGNLILIKRKFHNLASSTKK